MLIWSPIVLGLLAFLFTLFVLFGIMGNREGWESLSRFAEAQGLEYTAAEGDAPSTLGGLYRGIRVEVSLGAGPRGRTRFRGAIPELPEGLRLESGAGAAVDGAIPLGDPKLDGRLVTRAEDAGEARRILLYPKVRRALVGFFERHPDATLRDGWLSFSRTGAVIQPVELKRDLDELIKFAAALQTAGADRGFKPPPLLVPAALAVDAPLEVPPELDGVLPEATDAPAPSDEAGAGERPDDDPALAATLSALATPTLDGAARAEQLERLSGRALALALTIDRVGWTFGGDVAAEMKGGRTLYGAWRELPVTARIAPSQNDAVDALSEGGEVEIRASVVDWDALRGRLLVQGALGG